MPRRSTVTKQENVIEKFLTEMWENKKKLVGAFTSQGFEYRRTADDIITARFDQFVDKNSVNYQIPQIAKIESKGQTYLVFDLIRSGNDKIGNHINSVERIGVYDYPVTRAKHQLDENGQQKVVDIEISRIDRIYYIPYTTEVFDQLMRYAIEKISFLVQPQGSRKYGGFTPSEIRNLSIEELTQIGQFGRLQDREYKAKVAKQELEAGEQ